MKLQIVVKVRDTKIIIALTHMGLCSVKTALEDPCEKQMISDGCPGSFLC